MPILDNYAVETVAAATAHAAPGPPADLLVRGLHGGHRVYRSDRSVHHDRRICVVNFSPVHLGWLDEADYRIMDVLERTRSGR